MERIRVWLRRLPIRAGFRGRCPKAAYVYWVNNRLIIGPMRQTEIGLWIETRPAVIAPPYTRDQLAIALADALSASGTVTLYPTRKEYPAIRRDFHKAARVRSEKAFEKDALSIHVEEAGADLEIMPFVNRGEDGFHGDAADSIRIPRDDLEEAAARILRILFDA